MAHPARGRQCPPHCYAPRGRGAGRTAGQHVCGTAPAGYGLLRKKAPCRVLRFEGMPKRRYRPEDYDFTPGGQTGGQSYDCFQFAGQRCPCQSSCPRLIREYAPIERTDNASGSGVTRWNIPRYVCRRGRREAVKKENPLRVSSPTGRAGEGYASGDFAFRT